MYGLQVKTQNGMRSIADISATCRYVGVVEVNTPSGSAPLPAGWSPSNGVYVTMMRQAQTSYFRFSISGNNLVWTNGTGAVARVLFFLTNETTTGQGYGFYAKNGNGSVVIDDNFKAMIVRSRGTSAAARLIQGMGVLNYVHEIECHESDLVAVQWDVGDVVGSFGYNNGKRSVLSTRQTTNFMICDPNHTMPKSDWGLEIYNAAGVRIYDSGADLLDIKKAVSPRTSEVVAGMSCDPSVNYAFCCGAVDLYQEADIGGGGNGFYNSYFYTFGVRRLSSTSYAGRILHGMASYIPPFSVSGSGDAVVPHILMAG